MVIYLTNCDYFYRNIIAPSAKTFLKNFVQNQQINIYLWKNIFGQFINCLVKCSTSTPIQNRILLIENHLKILSKIPLNVC